MNMQKVSLVAAAILVTVLVIGGGWLALQGLNRPQVELGPADDDHLPVGMSPGPVSFGAPELADGVPWGYALTPEGAAAAAVTAVAVTGQPEVVFDPDRFAEVAAVVFTAEEAAVQARQVDAARIELELSEWGNQPAIRRLYFFTPLAVRLDAFDSGPLPAARVEVWAMTLLGVGDAGGAMFTTSTVELVADSGDWRVTRVDTDEGPTPLVYAYASQPGRVRGLLRDAIPTWPLPQPSVSYS
ncbi:MAG: hypothetical protein WD041_02220 [Nitriliruptoraceae bacterium]